MHPTRGGANDQRGREWGANDQRGRGWGANDQRGRGWDANDQRGREWGANDQRGPEWDANDQRGREWGANDQRGREWGANDQRGRGWGANDQRGREWGANDQRGREWGANDQRGREWGANDQRGREWGANDQRGREWGANDQRGREWGANDQRGREWGANDQRGREWGANDQRGRGWAQSDKKVRGRCSSKIYRPESSWSSPVLESNGIAILPQPPSELQSTPFIEQIFGHKSVISVFKNSSNNLKGYLIRGKLSVKPAESNSENSDNFISWADGRHSILEGMSFNHGCLFIPAPDLSTIVLLKNLSRVCENEVETENVLKYQIIHQLSYISEAIVGSYDETILVHVLLNVKQSVKSNINSITQKLAVYFANTSKFPNLKISFNSTSEKYLGAELRKIQDAGSVSNFNLYNFIQQMKDEKAVFRLKNCEFTCFSKPNCKLTDFEDVFKMIDSYLPPVRITPIETIPHFDAIGCGMLSGPSKEDTVEYKSFAQQEGEIKYFRDLVQKLQSEPFANGLFLNNITESKILKILEPNSEHINLDNFEFDWAYAGSYGIFPFEISYPEEPNSPMRCLANKLDQAVMKHLPFSALIISSLINSMPNEFFSGCKKSVFLNYFLEEKLKIIVYTPLVQISSLKNGKTWTRILRLVKQKQYFQNFLRPKILLLLEDYPKLYYIDNNLELQEYGQNLVQLLFTPLSPEVTERVKFIQRFLTLSCLNLDCELTKQRREYCSVEERLLHCDKEVDSKQSLSNCSSLSFFISPTQKNILSENKNFLVLAGQPGCGKSSLLLLKAEKESQKKEIDSIVFFVPEEKKPFREYIQNTVKKYGSPKLNQKFRLDTLDKIKMSLAAENMEEME